ncbi:MAG: hypothetical protein LBU30_06400 [Candidatus Methanoplasma sp.]|jgi:hypothetical protein|nr:hypothetical protein [Candidatus Methanoplasma sp.]
MDIDDFGLLELTISTFIGFLSALVVEYLAERLREAKDSQKALIGVADELGTIRDTIRSLKDTEYYLDPLETPVWDSLVFGGGIAKLKLKKDIILTYRHVDRLNNWENVRTNSFFGTHTESAKLDEKVDNNREQVLAIVERTLSNLEDVIP